MRRERQLHLPEAELVAGQERRRRGRLLDVLYVVAPVVLLAVVWAGVTWYSRSDRIAANNELVFSIMRSFAAGVDFGEPLAVGTDRLVLRTDLVMTVNEELRLERVSEQRLIDQGNILDVWGGPLRVRRGMDWLEIRSAGIDQLMGTGDDQVATRPVAAVVPSTQTPRSDDRGVPAVAP